MMYDGIPKFYIGISVFPVLRHDLDIRMYLYTECPVITICTKSIQIAANYNCNLYSYFNLKLS